jgi:glycerophosphoryl diester phosphodiesterase
MFSGFRFFLTTVTALSLLFAVFSLQTHAQHYLKLGTVNKARDFFRYTGNDLPIISGHRGGKFKGYPENAIETFDYVLAHTPAIFEIDPQLTRDSIIVLMHDATLERTTNGKGKVADYTLEELKKLKLKDAYGNLTPFGIPTLEETIKWAKDKTIINLDYKNVPFAMTVMITVHNATDALVYYKKSKNFVFSAFVKTPQALKEYEEAGIPWTNMIAYIGSENKPENQIMYDLLHKRGVMCMISTAPTYDKLKTSEARMVAYQQFRLAGADIIESDLPIEVFKAIENQLKMKSPKQKYFGL